MREIKFRAWDKSTERMATWSMRLDCWERWIRGQDDKVVLMQYTGLKDKNGVEIYEGDIVRPLGNPYSKKVRVITWLLNHGSMIGFNIGRGEANEVVGNIYEHPELLEPKS